MLAHPDRRRRLRHRSVLPVHRHQMGPGQLRRPHPTIHHRRLATTRRYPRLNSYSVGIDHDTSVFAAATIDKWWQQMGKNRYPQARRILITADGGGSNGHRPWLWKFELARLATATGLDITVCHYPPGTSKWNKIEHRLFSRITHNWRGRPLETYQTIVNLIANTTTTKGLTVQCELDPNLYPTKIKLTDEEKKTIPLVRHNFHGDWNYTVTSRTE